MKFPFENVFFVKGQRWLPGVQWIVAVIVFQKIHGLINVNRRTDEHVKVEEYSASAESAMSDILHEKL